MPIRHAAPIPPQLSDPLHRLAKEQSYRPPDFPSENACGDGNESIDAIMRRKRILLAGFVTRMEDTRLPKCMIFGELVEGAGCMGSQEKE